MWSYWGLLHWISIMLTDKVFNTDKWYWQILSFMLGFGIGSLLAYLGLWIPMEIVSRRKEKFMTVHKKLPPRWYTFVQVILPTAHFSFYIYTLVSVIQYIALYQKTRDIVFLSFGGIFLMGGMTALLVLDIKKSGEFGFYYKLFSGNKERLPVSF